MKLIEPQDALNLPDGNLDVVRPTAEGPALEKVQLKDMDLLEAAQLLTTAHRLRSMSFDCNTKSEIFAVAINQFDFRREFFEAFAS
jgi:hypothetical protein